MPGSVFDGVARLHFEFRAPWRPFGQAVDQRVAPEARAARRRIDALRTALDRRPGPGSAEAVEPRRELDTALQDQFDRIRAAIAAKQARAGAATAYPAMTRRAFGVRKRVFGDAEIGFQALVESADAVKVATDAEARFDASQPRTPRPRPAASADPADGVAIPRPPESIWRQGMSGGQLVRDLPDVGSLRSLLDAEGRKAYGGGWTGVTSGGERRGDLVMAAFPKDRLMAGLPRMTRGEELTSEPFWLNGRRAWVSAKAEVVGLTHLRAEPKAEVALATENSSQFSRRALHSRQVYLLAQLGALASAVHSKLGAAATFGGGQRRRTRSEQSTGGRTFSNAKIPTPLEHFDGSVKFTFAFHHGDESRQAAGVVPFGISVPVAEITGHHAAAPGHTFLPPEPAQTPEDTATEEVLATDKVVNPETVRATDEALDAAAPVVPRQERKNQEEQEEIVLPPSSRPPLPTIREEAEPESDGEDVRTPAPAPLVQPQRVGEPRPFAEPARPEPAADSFATVRERYPAPIARHPLWTMWGHNGPTPGTSSYAVEFPALGLRGVYAPPASGQGIGEWHWRVAGSAEPVAATPLTLRSLRPLAPAEPKGTAGTASAAETVVGTADLAAQPRLAADAARARLVAALDAAPWSAGLRWRGDNDDLYVFAPAGSAAPDVVFGAGLRPCGDELVHVAAHVRDGGSPGSAWLTASRDIQWLRAQAPAAEGGAEAAVLGRYGWRYDIAAPGGVDVNETLDLAAPHPERREILYPGGVDSRYIRGAQRLEQGRAAGPYTTNPGFVDSRASGIATEGTAG